MNMGKRKRFSAERREKPECQLEWTLAFPKGNVTTAWLSTNSKSIRFAVHRRVEEALEWLVLLARYVRRTNAWLRDRFAMMRVLGVLARAPARLNSPHRSCQKANMSRGDPVPHCAVSPRPATPATLCGRHRGGDGPRANTSEKGRCCRYSDGGFSPFGRTYEAPFSQPNSATLRGAAGPEPKMIWIPTPGCWC